MPRARKHLVCLSDTPYYHVTSRCVRRAFLCGVDPLTGKSYEHRRAWVEDRIRVLASIFCLDVCAYAVMSNHYHLVVRLRPEKATDWSLDDILARWTTLFRGPLLVQQYRAGKTLSAVETDAVRTIAAIYHSRLHSLSWFMKCLNEPIARQANAEDGCTGHFWEARFHSQSLMSDKALITAMAYVDLNPVRAGIEKVPESSRYTSIRARTHGGYRKDTEAGAVARLLASEELHHFDLPVRPLCPFAAEGKKVTSPTEPLPMIYREYLALVDATGRVAMAGKCGQIDPGLQPILERLGLSANDWLQAATAFQRHYRNGDLRLKQSA